MVKTVRNLLLDIATLCLNVQESVSKSHSEMSTVQNVCTADAGQAVSRAALQLEGRKFKYLPRDLLI